MRWLQRAFGFTRLEVLKGRNGVVQHASLAFDSGMIMLRSPGPSFKNPKQLGQATQALSVRVDNIDRHFARAKKAGATIIEELADHDYGDRRYGAEDPEGHQWYFAERLS
jgi:uncharacterized glyoxalase superfamily protein PhnB